MARVVPVAAAKILSVVVAPGTQGPGPELAVVFNGRGNLDARARYLRQGETASAPISSPTFGNNGRASVDMSLPVAYALPGT